MISLDNCVFRQGQFTLSADWTLAAGEKAAVIGPSGGGKSTLLGGIAGFLAPERGRVLLDGQDMRGRAPADYPVHMLFQEGNLFADLTAMQNVGLGLRPSLKLTNAEQEAVAEALDAVGLSRMMERKPAQLSGGQRSRVALARALLRDKPILAMDEPFAALGPALRREMLDLVGELLVARGKTLLMVTHSPADARALSDKIILVAGGTAHAPEPTEPLLDNPPPALADYLGEAF
ncbi:ATP-binding cassette domain-containing protein [Paracoccaceae bacterium GXU_MW_L88]